MLILLAPKAPTGLVSQSILQPDIIFTSQVLMLLLLDQKSTTMALPFAVSGYNKRDRLWANGGARYNLYNSAYNYWTPNASGATTVEERASDPATAALPVQDTDLLIANTQIFPGAGRRTNTGAINAQGAVGFYWSSISTATATKGDQLQVSSSEVCPIYENTIYPYGKSIRCVRI
jgi:hypothetical protein